MLLGLTPTLTSFAQLLLVGLHGIWNHYPKVGVRTPRVAFLLPAWNEADVLGASIDALMSIDYPAGAWRLYIVDDASTDNTPEVMHAKVAQYPGSVFHLRRDKGGEGKAHTLNHGIKAILADDWAEAVMIMDADVLFEAQTLRRMVRHLSDPKIGGVTAYVKEGSYPGALLSRFIAFEYVTAQAAARRTQNVMGGLACMAGGAQLHSRENLIAIGGAIDTSTLAEDTFTTFKTQLAGRRVLFDGNAIVWAEEPDSLAALWKQRVRWGRGNLQITMAFRDLWFRPGPQPSAGRSGIRYPVVQHRPDAAIHLRRLARPDRPLPSLDALGARELQRALGHHLCLLCFSDTLLLRYRSGRGQALLVRGHCLSRAALDRRHGQCPPSGHSSGPPTR